MSCLASGIATRMIPLFICPRDFAFSCNSSISSEATCSAGIDLQATAAAATTATSKKNEEHRQQQTQQLAQRRPREPQSKNYQRRCRQALSSLLAAHLVVGHRQQQEATKLERVREPIEQAEPVRVPLLTRGDRQHPEDAAEDLTGGASQENQNAPTHTAGKIVVFLVSLSCRVDPTCTRCRQKVGACKKGRRKSAGERDNKRREAL